MSLSYKRIGLTVKSGLDSKSDHVSSALSLLEGLGCEVFVDEKRTADVSCTEGHPSFEQEDIDLLVVLGGDGTILRTVREMTDYSVPLLTINKGTVGFLSELHLKEMEAELPKLLNGEGIIEERSLLTVKGSRGSETVFQGIALNEAVIAQGTIARLVDLQTSVNGERLTTFHADGLIIATPTGSTAYSLAAGGPIVHPSQQATILTPINPHSFTQKPIVIPSEQEVSVEVLTKENKFKDTEVVCTLDGQVYIPLQSGDRITACCCGTSVKFLRRKQDTFYGTLREKLKWGERLES